MDGVVRHAASAILFDAGGRVLLIRENYGGHRYGPPGGLVEPGETPWEAAVREAREETGVEVVVDRLIGLYLVPKETPLVSFAFRCRLVGGVPAVQDEGEIAEVGWFDPARLPRPMTNSGPAAIADALRGELGVVRTVAVRVPP